VKSLPVERGNCIHRHHHKQNTAHAAKKHITGRPPRLREIWIHNSCALFLKRSYTYVLGLTAAFCCRCKTTTPSKDTRIAMAIHDYHGFPTNPHNFICNSQLDTQIFTLKPNQNSLSSPCSSKLTSSSPTLKPK
jgi:hypothetical protein